MKHFSANSTGNDYARQLFGIAASKPVFMAIAYSFALRICDDDHDRARALVLEEWQVLHDNGIVPQKPRKDKSK